MAEDSNVSSLLSTLLNGGYQAPGSGMQALAGGEPMTGATVLARLKGAGNGAMGRLGTGGSAVPNDLSGSKLGGLVSGFANGMKDAADARAAQQKQSIELMKLQWDHQFKTAELKQKIDSGNATAAETKRYHDILDKYYTGQNEKQKKDDDPGSPANVSQIELARQRRAKSEGLFDEALKKHAIGAPANAMDPPPSPQQVQEAKDELASRMAKFRKWESEQSWNKGKDTTNTTPPKADDTTPDPPIDPNANPDTGNVPTPPARPTDLAPPAAPDLSPPAQTGTPAAPAGPRSVTGPDGKKYTYTPETGLVPATPDSAVPSDDTAPAWIPGT